MGKPIKNIRSGHVQGTVWENEGQTGKYNSFTFKKTYKSKEGKWEDTMNFQSNDLADLTLVVQEALKSVKLKVFSAQQQTEEAPASSQEENLDKLVFEDIGYIGG